MWRTKWGMAIALTLLGTRPAPGADGRDFAGFYQHREAIDRGADVEVTLTVRVFNYSDADVGGASIVFEDSLVPGHELGRFARIDIRDRESTRVSGSFVIPRREYERWQQGATPSMRIELTDASSIQTTRRIELAQGLTEEEEQ